jgi:hypothetical protein
MRGRVNAERPTHLVSELFNYFRSTCLRGIIVCILIMNSDGHMGIVESLRLLFKLVEGLSLSPL